MSRKKTGKDGSGKNQSLIGKRDYIDKILTLTYPRLVEGKMTKPMSIYDACKEVGITYQTLCNWRKADELLDRAWRDVQDQRREMMHITSEDVIEKALSGETKGIRPAEKVNIAFRLLEKTKKEYQPKQQLEVKSVNLDFSMSTEEMMKKAQELARELNLD